MSSDAEVSAMPQPLSRVRTGAIFIPKPDYLADKPHLATLVSGIFAHAASIEYWQDLLLVRILGADINPAHAIFSILRTQQLQSAALRVAAAVALSTEELNVFVAGASVAESVQTPRNHLAHWIWGHSPDLPDALLLADPDAQTERDRRLSLFLETTDKIGSLNVGEFVRLGLYDPNTVLVYGEGDLERANREMKDAAEIMGILTAYLDGLFKGRRKPPVGLDLAATRDGLFRRLYGKRMFREALDRRIRKDRETPP